MVASDVSDMSRWHHNRQYSDERYTDAALTNSYISRDGFSIYQNAGVESPQSPPLTARTDFTAHPASPSLDATLSTRDDMPHTSPTLGTTSPPLTETAARSTSEQLDAKSRHISEGSEVAFSENFTSPLPQAVDDANPAPSAPYVPRPPSPPVMDRQGRGLHPIDEEEERQKRQPVEVEVEKQQQQQQHDQRRKCGMRIPIFWMMIIGFGVAALALALGLGLGLTLGRERDSSDSNGGDSNGDLASANSSIGGAINPQYYSRAGAFNGSGVALATASTSSNTDNFIFYQTWDGQLRQLLRTGSGAYTSVATVATNAKNATPISVVSFVDAGAVSRYHLFYIDRDNNIREMLTNYTAQSRTNNWVDGPLSAQNVKAFDADLVGLQACYYGPQANATNANAIGINLFVGENATTVRQWDWQNGASTWTRSFGFGQTNGGAGIACQSFHTSNTTVYLFTIDVSGTVRVSYRDNDPNAPEASRRWTYAPITIGNVARFSSLAYADYLAYQTTDGLVHGRALNFAGTNTNWSYVAGTSANNPAYNEWTTDANNRGILNSHLGITVIPTGSGGRELGLFYQSLATPDGGDGLSLGLRDSSATGSWDQQTVQIG